MTSGARVDKNALPHPAPQGCLTATTRDLACCVISQGQTHIPKRAKRFYSL